MDTLHEQPITRDGLVIALLGMIGSPIYREQAHETLEQLYRLPVTSDPLLRELHLLRVAMGLVDYGANLVSSTPLISELGSLVVEVLGAIQALDSQKLTHHAEQMQYAITLLEAALTDDWSGVSIQDRKNPELRAMVNAMRDRIKEQPLHQDMVSGSPMWYSTLSFSPPTQK